MSSTTSPQTPLSTQREALLQRLKQPHQYDMAVIGGGATGLGVALDAAARGFSVVLLESHDFAKGTSSRATKLLHGGVRYLAQGNIALVREALHERTTLLANAPHLAQPLAFVMPSYKLWETPFYGIGLKVYDALAGKAGLGPTQFLTPCQALKYLPTLRSSGLKGGVRYWDGQFDDARLALALARTAAVQGALLVNYCAVTGLIHEEGRVVGLHAKDQETGDELTIRATCVVNATGVWVDQLRLEDGAALGRPTESMVAPSQGVHLVVDRSFLLGDDAMLIPKTADGRVLFAVPWLGSVILGTTDTPRHDLAREPLPFKDEVDFILRETGQYLCRTPAASDVKSIWVGLRPLVKPPEGEGDNTQSLSREHTVLVSKSGLVTVTGGKWTTYRAMALDVLEKCFRSGVLSARIGTSTESLRLVGATSSHVKISDPPGLHLYGSEAQAVQVLPGADHPLGGGLSEAMVRFAVRYQYARTVEDVLARRSRLLFTDAALAATLVPEVERILREEGCAKPGAEAFLGLCRQYLTLPT